MYFLSIMWDIYKIPLGGFSYHAGFIFTLSGIFVVYNVGVFTKYHLEDLVIMSGFIFTLSCV